MIGTMHVYDGDKIKYKGEVITMLIHNKNRDTITFIHTYNILVFITFDYSSIPKNCYTGSSRHQQTIKVGSLADS